MVGRAVIVMGVVLVMLTLLLEQPVSYAISP
jgi:hypothetical protein